MSTACHRALLVLPIVLLSLLSALRAPAAAPAKPTPREIAQWIRELGDDSFSVREKASKKLWAAGQAAEAALEEALKSSDVEVVRRARDILEKFKWGIYPDTPAEIVALVQAYQSTEGNTRLEMLQKLLQAGPAGLQAVLKISKVETDPNKRKALADLISSKLPASFVQVLADSKYEQFEVLLELGHGSGAIRDNQYAAYWLLRGKLDERIAHFRALLAKTPTDKRSAETLAYLHRAKGDLAEARKAAEKSERADLIEGILYELGDWKGLAARTDVAGTNVTIEKWAYRAAYARLAGNQKDLETALSDLGKLVEKGPERESYRFAAAKAFLLNDRPAEGLALLAKDPPRQTVLFEILCTRLQYREAMKLADQHPADSNERRQLEVLTARTLYVLGEKDKAQAMFTRLGEQIKDGASSSWLNSLLETEYRIGLKDQAFEHCARALNIPPSKDSDLTKGTFPRSPYLDKVFPQRTEAAQVWWDLLHAKFKDEAAAMVLKRLRNLMEGKIAAKEVKAWIEEADRPLSVPNTGVLPAEVVRRRQAMAEVAATAGLDDLARSLLEKVDTPEALIRLGDLFVAKKQWAKAAQRYRQAWQKGLTANDPFAGGKRSDPLPLYLAGWSLVKAGQEQEGKKLIEQSHWALLGDAPGRAQFLGELDKRGHAEAAQREADLLLRVSEPNSHYSGVAMRRLALVAMSRKDYLKAALGYEQSMLRCLRMYTNFIQPAAYAGVPAHVHRLRASGLLAAERFEEANKEIRLALALAPGNVDLAIALVPDLERRGHKKEAAALFNQSLAGYEKLCRDYPRCAWAHNSVAWLSACCRRNLDNGLTHAQKAVELDPTNAGHLDTLAEVHFQRGDKDKAIALQKRVIELDPKKEYFRKQLRRLEAGDPSADRPPEGD